METLAAWEVESTSLLEFYLVVEVVRFVRVLSVFSRVAMLTQAGLVVVLAL